MTKMIKKIINPLKIQKVKRMIRMGRIKIMNLIKIKNLMIVKVKNSLYKSLRLLSLNKIVISKK
jgi:hypothetical protein